MDILIEIIVKTIDVIVAIASFLNKQHQSY